MKQIAELIARVLIKKEEPEKVRKDVIEFRKNYVRVHYTVEGDLDTMLDLLQ